MKKFLLLVLFLILNQGPALALNKAVCSPVLTPIVDLVAEPKKFLGKTVFLEGELNSFSTLALDYPKAMRSSKDYIGIVLSRPDHKNIPLVELKLAVPIKKFKEEALTGLEHGDIVQIRGHVFAVSLGEPWLDVESITITQKIAPREEDGDKDSDE